jgi:hypothetical protein
MRLSDRRSYEGALCVVVCVVALSAFGCGGSAAKADPKADKAAAKAATLIKSDLPGFIALPYKSSEDGLTPSEKRRLAKCMRVDVDSALFGDTQGAQIADSPTFKRDHLSIDSEIEIDPNSKSIDAVFDVFDQGKFEDCLGAWMKRSMVDAVKDTPGATIGTPDVSRTRPELGDRAARFLVDVPFSGPGVAATSHSEALFVKKGRAVVMLSSNDFAPIFTDRTDELATTILNRLRGNT